MTERELGWLEAVFDTRGSFILSYRWDNIHQRHMWKPSIQFCSCSKTLIQKLSGLLEKSPMAERGGKQRPGKFRITLSPDRIRNILPSLRLCEKKQQKEIMLEALGILKERHRIPYSRTMRKDRKLSKLCQAMHLINRSHPVNKPVINLSYNRPEPYFGNSPNK